METCYKLFRTDLIQNLQLNEKRFGFEREITTKISKYRKSEFMKLEFPIMEEPMKRVKKLVGKMV